ncbi:hypothetical protein JRY13_14040 [Lacticaseibacillus paracasei]|jgi:hypothetical protein|uniref:type IV toxin-antitoxin system AbiEi family antitoxin domain-containing protein n=1 Tax=Lacticaseibacillus paracasei TaxID=1597 RepID=UPI00194F0675|nr:hypothetical protein [Lacticaseibacillus paracasei]MBM6642316.1 hypothetical protein [Lacticaseibacillus paracasei]
MSTRKTAVDVLNENQDILKLLTTKYGNVLNRSTLINMLSSFRNDYGVSINVSLNGFIWLLTERTNLFERVSVLVKGKLIRRYIPTFIDGGISPYEIALSLANTKKAYFSHLSAMYINNLTNLEPTTIYVNSEQSPKPANKENAVLTQRKVDAAFSRPVRTTSNIASFQYQKNNYNVVLLNGKSTKYTGVMSFRPMGFSKEVRVADTERTLIEATVRPSYSGGVSEVLSAYRRARIQRISVNKILGYLNQMNYIYPYIQPIYFYTLNSGFNLKQLSRVKERMEERNSGINMYLDHQMIGPVLEKKANVYIPSSISRRLEKNTIDPTLTDRPETS